MTLFYQCLNVKKKKIQLDFFPLTLLVQLFRPHNIEAAGICQYNRLWGTAK